MNNVNIFPKNQLSLFGFKNNMVWHGKALSDDEYDTAINELRTDIL